MLSGVTFPMHACGVPPITMHWVSWPIRAECTGSVGQSEQTALVGRRGFVDNNEFERAGGQRNYNNVQYLRNNVFFGH